MPSRKQAAAARRNVRKASSETPVGADARQRAAIQIARLSPAVPNVRFSKGVGRRRSADGRLTLIIHWSRAPSRRCKGASDAWVFLLTPGKAAAVVRGTTINTPALRRTSSISHRCSIRSVHRRPVRAIRCSTFSKYFWLARRMRRPCETCVLVPQMAIFPGPMPCVLIGRRCDPYCNSQAPA
jgi:hypothetical protein